MQKILPILLLLSTRLFAQIPEPGAQAASLGGSYLSQKSILAAYHNVAGTLMRPGLNWAFGARNNYLAHNLNQYYAVVSLQKEKSALGADLMGYGFSAYQEMLLGLNYAQMLTKSWQAGVRLKYGYRQIADNSLYQHNVLADVGFLGVFKSWRVGASLQNFAQSGWLGGEKEYAAVILRIGGGYYFKEHTAISAEVHQSIHHKTDVRLGLSYAPADALRLRFGFATANPSVSFGCGFVVKNIEINLATSWHQQLGLSPVIDVVSQ